MTRIEEIANFFTLGELYAVKENMRTVDDASSQKMKSFLLKKGSLIFVVNVSFDKEDVVSHDNQLTRIDEWVIVSFLNEDGQFLKRYFYQNSGYLPDVFLEKVNEKS